MKRRAAFVLVAAATLLAGCTEVPRSSEPDVVASQGLAPPPQHAKAPKANLASYQIVSEFLARNADSDPTHFDSRQYLTSAANTRWTDDRVTVVDNYHVSTTDHPEIVDVETSVLGTVDAASIYTPVLAGDGTGRSQEFKFHMTQVKLPHYDRPQWRIDTLLPGLILNSTGFQQQYQQRSVYFYDATEQHLVPDPRYTSLVQPGDLANWLLRTLAAGPRDALSAAERTGLPGQTDPTRVKVQIPEESSAPAKITIPGAAQRGVDRKQLAVQVAATLAQVAQISSARLLTIVDGDAKVTIPDVGATFSASEFAAQIVSNNTIPELYYVDDGGGVVRENGEELPGRIGSGYYDLTSVALTGAGSNGLLIAGTRGADENHRTLDVGSETTALEPVDKVTGALSRPTWAPDLAEMWIGAGTKLYRVSLKGAVHKVPMSTANGDPASGKVLAVRFSPEGSRVALVLESDDAKTSTIWVGNVERGKDTETVQVDGLTQVTPIGIVMRDVAWNDALKLYGIGHDAVTKDAGYYEVQCDGSRWSARGIGNLPDEPTSITVASGHVLAVAAAGSVWKQSGNTWQSPHGDEAPGTAPVYVE